MRDRLVVVASDDDTPVPLENNPSKLVRNEPVSVPNTPYYRRRIKKGELVEVPS